jgi:formylglycine-generating enzyme required for sulfatase activity
MAYSNWLAQATGKPYRLPSEAEWEKGARGSDGRIYPWGNQWDVDRCNTGEGGKGDTTPVGAYPEGASPYGLLDMAGK